jgi:hypothetical protein
MKQVFKTTVRSISILVAIILVWNLASGWLLTGPGQGIARAAAFSVQPVEMAPLNAPALASKGSTGKTSPQSPDPSVAIGITYQGRLLDNNVPANGQYDFVFTLFDALSGGNQISTPVNITNQTVSSGLFSASLDFGPGAFGGDARWLEIGVRSTGGGSYVTLSPRQSLSAAPFALGSRWEGTTDKPFPYDSVPRTYSVSTIDSTADVGKYTSAAIGADGFALISYSDETNHTLKVAHCSNLACTSSTTAIIDNSTVGEYTAIVLGADGLGLISYFATATGDLKVAHCDNIICSTATISAVDTVGQVGMYSSITIGVDGFGLIAYLDLTNHNLKMAHCSNVACTSSTTAAIGIQNRTGPNMSVTIGSDGLGLVSFYDQASQQLRVAHCSNLACTSGVYTTIDTATYTGWFSSITIGTDGLGLISYQDSANNHLKVAHCSNVQCTSSTTAVIDTGTNSEQPTSITIGTDGLGLISYSDGNVISHLKVAHCTDLACDSASTTVVDPDGYFASISLGADGLGLVSYYDQENTDLKVLHCANSLCIPYQHAR